MAKPADIVRMPRKRTYTKPGRPPSELTGQPHITIRLLPDVHKWLVQEANHNMRSLSGQISWIVSQYYRNHK